MRRQPGGFALAAALLLALVAAPVVFMLLSVSPRAVLDAYAANTAQSALRTSLLSSLCAVALSSALGIPAAYELARWPDRARWTAIFVLALPLAFPPVACGIILLNFLGTHSGIGSALYAHGISMIDSFAGVVGAQFFVAGSFIVITACAAFRNLDPAVEETAATLGASRAQTFFHITLPLAAPNIAAGMLLAWLRAIGEYGATSIVAYHPTTLPIALTVSLGAQGVPQALALSYGFVALAALIVALQWAVRRRVV